MRSRPLSPALLVAAVIAGCVTGDRTPAPPSSSPAASPEPNAAASRPARIEHPSEAGIEVGEPIDIDDLAGRVVFDDFEDLYAMDVDGSNLVVVADDPAGSEFDGAWSPDGEWIVYRDSTRGINVDDEIYVARADGSEKRNITNDPANDWGPDWSADGSTIVFNSDRDGSPLQGYLMNPDGSNLRRIDVDTWFEYPSFSPDGSRVVFEGHVGGSYDVFIADLATGVVTLLVGGPGNEGWPAWSPDGATIAFTSERDDCAFASPEAPECWRDGPEDAHRDTWLIDADGTNLRRVTPERGQFVAWSPDGRYLLISGRALYVVRPDGTGRIEIRTPTVPLALGGIPDWRAP